MRLLIIGANSDIAKECARKFAQNGFNIVLANRNVERLNDFKRDLEVRFNRKVLLKEFDITKFETHKNFYKSLENIDGVLVAAGLMYDQKECENDIKKTLDTINVNYTGLVSIVNIISNDFENKKKGFIIGISSVAGDRGRKTNYIYGSSKAGFTAYLSGLRNRLYEVNVQVLTVKPGFVYTKMTAHLNLPDKLTATPEQVAEDIFKAWKKRKDILYTKWIWKYIMCIIKHIPEKIFKRMSI